MKRNVKLLVLTACAALVAVEVQAQTADEVIEKHLAAIGGRAALGKLESRVATGTIMISAQGAELGGSVDIYLKAPNKSRSYIKVDMSQFGAGEMVVDQRCDGKTAYASNSLQGDREITGQQLQGMLNSTFPTPLLTVKESGAKVELVGKEKVGTRDAYVVAYTPKTGPASKQYYDAETYMLVRTVSKMDIPEMGGEVEQTSDVSDYRDVDGIKIPFKTTVVNSMQTIAITLTKVENNKPLEDAMFSRVK
jgi:outer membrane lipoprotein-sorting protein